MAILFLPDPVGMSWQVWVDAVVGYNPDLARAAPDDSYVPFAQGLSQIDPRTPNPELFATWEEWAAALKQAL